MKDVLERYRAMVETPSVFAVDTSALLRDMASIITKFNDALEQIALLDEAGGYGLTEKQAFEAVAIACQALGNKHPSVILVEREARKKAGS